MNNDENEEPIEESSPITLMNNDEAIRESSPSTLMNNDDNEHIRESSPITLMRNERIREASPLTTKHREGVCSTNNTPDEATTVSRQPTPSGHNESNNLQPQSPQQLTLIDQSIPRASEILQSVSTEHLNPDTIQHQSVDDPESNVPKQPEFDVPLPSVIISQQQALEGQLLTGQVENSTTSDVKETFGHSLGVPHIPRQSLMVEIARPNHQPISSVTQEDPGLITLDSGPSQPDGEALTATTNTTQPGQSFTSDGVGDTTSVLVSHQSESTTTQKVELTSRDESQHSVKEKCSAETDHPENLSTAETSQEVLPSMGSPPPKVGTHSGQSPTSQSEVQPSVTTALEATLPVLLIPQQNFNSDMVSHQNINPSSTENNQDKVTQDPAQESQPDYSGNTEAPNHTSRQSTHDTQTAVETYEGHGEPLYDSGVTSLGLVSNYGASFDQSDMPQEPSMTSIDLMRLFKSPSAPFRSLWTRPKSPSPTLNELKLLFDKQPKE